MSFKTEIINVTPQLAAEWLKADINRGNRMLRPSVVDGFKSALLRGEYLLTHQGIAFSDTGALLDGQHRLTAISQLREGSFPMLVTRGMPEETFRAMDIGLKRTPADSLREDDRRLVECARLIAFICMNKPSRVSPVLLVPLIDEIRRPHTSLVAFCPTSSKLWSSAPVRVAAMTAILTGTDEQYVRAIYRALVLSDFDAMPPIVHSLYRSATDGHVHARDYADVLARMAKAFNPRMAHYARMQVRETAEATAKVRATFSHLIAHANDNEPPKKAVAVAQNFRGDEARAQ